MDEPPTPDTRTVLSTEELRELAANEMDSFQKYDFTLCSDETLAELAEEFFVKRGNHAPWKTPPLTYRKNYKTLRQWGRMSTKRMMQELKLASDDNVELSPTAGSQRQPLLDVENMVAESTTNTNRISMVENVEFSMSGAQANQTSAVNNSELLTSGTQTNHTSTVDNVELSRSGAQTNTTTHTSTVDNVELSPMPGFQQQPLDEATSSDDIEPQPKRPCYQQSEGLAESTTVTPATQDDAMDLDDDNGIPLGTAAAAAKYAKGDVVLYTCARYEGLATIVDVHYDDDLVPYYTILVGETEKQTTEERLSPAPCQGLTLQYLLSKKRSDRTKLDNGYSRIAADAGHRYSTAMGQRMPWPVDPCKYNGCIDDPKTDEVRMLLRCQDNNVPCDDGEQVGPHWNFGFVSSHCTGTSVDGGPCQCCLVEEEFLVKKCYQSASRNNRDPTKIDGVNLGTEQSPSKLRNGSAVRTEDKRLSRQQERKLDRRLKRERKKIANSKEREMSHQLMQALEIEHPAELYTDQVKKLWDEELKGESIERKRLAETLFQENKLHAERARECGKKTCRFSNPMYSFVIQLRIKLGGGRYDFLANVCGLPSDRQVRRRMAEFSSAATVCNGGILHENIQEAGEMVHGRYGDIPLDDPRRAFEVGWDSTVIVEGLEISMVTNQVVGVAYDGEGGGNFFKSALDTMGDIFEDDGEKESSDADAANLDSENTKVDRAEHYLVFLASSLDRNTPLIRVSVARYALKSVDADFLKRHVDAITHAMFVEGLVVRGVAFDGASENRSWAKWRATHTVDDLIALGRLPQDWKDDKHIPKKLKVAYLHPSFDPGDLVFVLLHPDMSHALKKVINAFEFSGADDSARDLIFRNQAVTLMMIFEKWEESRGSPGQIRTTRLSIDHFVKNANSRMRSYLAFQITSLSVVAMLDDLLDDKDEIEEYAPMRELLLLFNDLIDIMNDKADKGKSGIASKSHPDLVRLETLLKTIEEWLQTVKADDDLDLDNFLPMSTYEDLSWLVIGTTGLVYSCCEQGDIEFTLALGRCGTDPIENRFGDMKGRYTNRLTVKNANSGNHMADVHSGQGFNMKNCGNARGSAIPTAPLRERKRKR